MAEAFTVKSVIESVLDAKGFDDFKRNIKEAADASEQASQRTASLGKSATGTSRAMNTLGRSIPNAGVALFSSNLLAASGNATGMRAATTGLNIGVRALSISMPMLGIGIGVAAAAAAILIPKLREMRETAKTVEDGIAKMAGTYDRLKGSIEQIIEYGGTLTPVLQETYDITKALAEEALEKEIEQNAIVIDDLEKTIKLTKDRIRGEERLSKLEGIYALQRLLWHNHLENGEELLAAQNLQLREAVNLRNLLAQADKEGLEGPEDVVAGEEDAALKQYEERTVAQKKLQDMINDFYFQEGGQDRVRMERKREDNRVELQLYTDILQTRLRHEREAAQAERAAAAEKRRRLAEEAARRHYIQSQLQGSMQALWGQQKSFAVAMAVVNTYEGATKALAQGGIAGPALAAIVIAFGMAQVAKMMASEPAGFDNPKSDVLAERYGVKWADDLLKRLDMGFANRLGGGATPGASHLSSTSNIFYNTGPHYSGGISVRGIFGAGKTNMLKTLERDLIKVRRLETRGTIR